ncbi:ribosome maturation factor RimP [Enorma phocaeensis]|uniref:ribosome maturation factor RimP n=1 Tax=Enorma phocaeensis TaxID=1871019 RepID=UPI0019569E1D|nr:ribosome maturation factor RimP [Enorma phocaeensis]MBM6952365.1 ribosome maturation factor RimP [Enorma phocaeensis]
MVKSKVEQLIIDALEAQAPEKGTDIVDVEVVGATKAPTVRVRIEGADGESLTLDEVTAHTSWVSDVVEGIDPVPGAYTLEVSSPGMARPLRRPQDFVRFCGEDCQLTTTATEGRKKFGGRIAQADDHAATLELEDGSTMTFAYDEIKKCVLKPVYDFKGSKEGKN